MPTRDRTFSDVDIVRIFERHLDAEERLRVQAFFGGQAGGALFTPAELDALQLTKAQIFERGQVIDTLQQLLFLLDFSKGQIPFEWAQLEIAEVIDNQNQLRQLLQDPIFDVPVFGPALLAIYRPGVEIAMTTLNLVQRSLDPFNLMFLIADAINRERIRLDAFESNAGIWSDRV